MKNIKIFCDMDGTLTDFSGAVEAIGHADGLPDDAPEAAKEAMIKAITDQGIPFWSRMNWKQGSRELWDFIKPYDPILLSSPGTGGRFTENAMAGKKLWVDKNMPGTPLYMEHEKYHFAERDAILIDDMAKNIKSWIKFGGIGVFHRDTPTTIQELKRLINVPNIHMETVEIQKEQMQQGQIQTVMSSLRGIAASFLRYATFEDSLRRSWEAPNINKDPQKMKDSLNDIIPNKNTTTIGSIIRNNRAPLIYAQRKLEKMTGNKLTVKLKPQDGHSDYFVEDV
jgi:hypothetical protein